MGCCGWFIYLCFGNSMLWLYFKFIIAFSLPFFCACCLYKQPTKYSNSIKHKAFHPLYFVTTPCIESKSKSNSLQTKWKLLYLNGQPPIPNWTHSLCFINYWLKLYMFEVCYIYPHNFQFTVLEFLMYQKRQYWFYVLHKNI